MSNIQHKNTEQSLSFQNDTFDFNYVLDDTTLVRYLLENIPSQVFWKDKNLYMKYKTCYQIIHDLLITVVNKTQGLQPLLRFI